MPFPKPTFVEPTFPESTSSAADLLGALPDTPAALLGALPTSGYQLRPPSPPHINVPPLHGAASQIVLPDHSGIGDDPERNDLLAFITQGTHTSVEKGEWQYSWRRQAQPILSFLWLGPAAAAKDIGFLRASGITMLLAIRDTQMAMVRMLSGQKISEQLGIEAESIDVDGNQQLIAAFPRAVKVINDHLIRVFQHRFPPGSMEPEGGFREHCGKVLIFCESGNERSAAVVAAYIMTTYGISLQAAIQYVQNQRFCIAFDDPLKHLLDTYQGILEAKKIVGAMNNPSIQPAMTETSRGLKRGADEEEADEDRFIGRTEFVPFQ